MTIWEIAPKNWVDQKALIHLSIIDVTRDIAPTNRTIVVFLCPGSGVNTQRCALDLVLLLLFI